LFGDVKALVENGADVSIRGDYDYTPLEIARHHEHHDVVQFLQQHGAGE